MKAKSVLLVCFIMAAIFSCSMVGYIFGTTVAREESSPQNLAQVKQKASAPQPEVSVLRDTSESKESVSTETLREIYVLREEDGKIALFKKSANGKETFHSSYDVPIMFLPKSDREALQKGIEFESLDEIVHFIEDYVG